MRINYDGIDIDVDIIGGFKIETNEYAVCSYVDSGNNYKIVILQVVRNGDDIQVKNIPNDEMDLVLSKYKEIEKEMLEGDGNE